MKSAKKQKKGHITEEDMSNLLHRYPAQKVLTLLQEMAQSVDAKMDWNALVKKSVTGITNAREYQMLWRHLAYHEELLEKVDDAAEPLDDDSDLEYELEAFPSVSVESATEAAACVKVLIGSGLPGDSKVPNRSTVEAPLVINIPNGQSSKKSLESSLPALQGTNITVPVSVQKQPVPQGSVQKQSVPVGQIGEGSDANGSTSTTLPPRRKRKPWTEEEDLELLAAVKKCGEGNWANILKGDFKGERTASQLSQRWAIIRKKQSSLSIGGQSNGPQLSDAQLAARRAIDMALKDNLLTVGNGAATTSNPSPLNPSNDDSSAANNSLPQPQQSQTQINPAGGIPISSKPAIPSSVPNQRAPPPKKGLLKPVLDSSMVTKVAVAAGARIASPKDAASLFKAAQANNAVHIMPKGGTTLIKSSVTSASTSNPTPSTNLGPNRTMPFGSQQPARANLARPTTTPSIPTSSVPISHATGNQPVRSTFMRPVVLPSPSSLASTSSSLPNKVEVKKEEKTSEVIMKATLPPPQPMARPIPPQNAEARKKPSPVSSSTRLVASSQAAAKENSQGSVNTEKHKSSAVSTCDNSNGGDLKNKIESLADGKHVVAPSVKQEEIANEKNENLPSSKVGGGVKSEVKIETSTGAEKSEKMEQ